MGVLAPPIDLSGILILLWAHLKFQNPRTIPSWRKVNMGREKVRRERKRPATPRDSAHASLGQMHLYSLYTLYPPYLSYFLHAHFNFCKSETPPDIKSGFKNLNIKGSLWILNWISNMITLNIYFVNLQFIFGYKAKINIYWWYIKNQLNCFHKYQLVWACQNVRSI